jgi:cyclic beta-1,2-glucan synthetase
MGLVALGNVLADSAMQERFHRDPVVQTAELLLQERVPRRVQLAKPHVEEVAFVRSVREVPPPVARSYPTPHTPVPATHFLSNGSYSVMVTNAGGGYSRWRDRTVTRYREDLTRDCWGFFVYVKDVESKRAWSAAYQPTCTEPDDYHVVFSPDKAEFRRIDDGIETHTEIVVSPEDDVEVRRLTVTNRRREPAYLELTSYAEITLAVRGADQAHRAFGNLFVETEALDELGALLFSRRPRSAEEPRVWAVHTIACDLTARCTWSYETDRAAFLGRLGTPAAAQAIVGDGRLTGTTGAVLDPICSIRQTLVLEPGQSARLAISLSAADSREKAVAYAEKYRDIRSAQRALDLAWSTSQIELKDLGITPQEAVVYQRLASRLLLTDPYSRLKVYTEAENRLPISALWSIGISGDYPILLVEIERLEDTPLVRQALLAHQYWRSRGFECDLVVLNTKPSAYSSALDGRLRALVRTGHALQMLDRPAGVHLRTADQIAPEIVDALRSVARAVLTADAGPIALQLDQRAVRPLPPNPLAPSEQPAEDPLPPFERPWLALDNGIGGFDPETGEYVIVLEPGQTTPAPWINVFANPSFGAYVSEAGVGCTWAMNSHENRISTWNNDPVSDGTGELLYVRDDATGEYWSPTPAPARADAPYIVRHAPGCTTFEHASHGLAQRVAYFVSADKPVRIATVSLENLTDRPRRISLFHVVEWSLGDSRSKAQQRVVTWWDDQAQALMAHNWFNPDFPGRPAFLAADREIASFTADRTEFLGRNGHPAWPAAMQNEHLAGTTGRFLDNCGALQVTVELPPGERAEAAFFLGQTETVEEAHSLLHGLREPGAVDREIESARSYWRDLLGRLEIRTPDELLDRLVNGPVLYQALACRYWGRTALYQSSGAFGFRDQLQDCLALLYVRPDLVREHIIEASRRQFPEGDVLHWWQPVSGRGVRTRFVDDRLWLPLVVAEYVNATGDESVLDVETPFVEGPPVPPEREDLYFEPKPSVEVATVYEHCVRAIEASAGSGPHGLPLMGGGDWNDGMNRVGIGGTGESVWMAWFLDVVLRSFADVAEHRGEVEAAEQWRERARTFIASVEREAWDGAWYRRAYFDDGTPLGSRSSEECKIDAIAQAWAAISASGDPARTQRALESVEEKLIRWDDGLVALLTPPFDRIPHDPGYIKGYVPGVRENGGQYTHAAVWVALAYAALGDGDEAVAILDLINPLSHTADAEAVARYKVEPYALAADVYSVEPHVGRGGWTWYTGSAAWYYRVAVRDICGLHLLARDGKRFMAFEPCVPKSWNAWAITYRYGSSTYEISFENPRGVNRGVERVEHDGVVAPDGLVPLVDDGKVHLVRVVMLGG